MTADHGKISTLVGVPDHPANDTPVSRAPRQSLVQQFARTRRRERLRLVAGRVAVLAVLVAAWQGIVSLGIIEEFWISSPAALSTRLIELVRSPQFYGDVYTTVLEMALGLTAGVILGAVVGMALARLPFLHRVLDPYIMVLYSMPRIALAPLFILWLGIGLASKVVLAGFVAFFIMFVNTHAGFTAVDKDLVNAVRTAGGSESFITRRVRLPSAVPWLLSGMRLSAGYALPAAVVAEMLGSRRGIGHEIARAAGVFDTTSMFAYLIVLGALAMTLNAGLQAAERRLLRWRS